MTQELLNLSNTKTQVTKSGFSKSPQHMSVAEYFADVSLDGFWSEQEIKKTIKQLRENMRGHWRCTASEWKILQSGLLHLFIDRGHRNLPCDFLLMATAWQHDETHLRHMSFGNWGNLEDKENTNYGDLMDVANSSDTHDFGEWLVESIRTIAGQHEISEDTLNEKRTKGTIFQSKPYPLDSSHLCWKLIGGGSTDWEHEQSEQESEDYDQLMGVEPVDEGQLYMFYFDKKKNLKMKELVSVYTTEPRLVTEGDIEIEWNC